MNWIFIEPEGRLSPPPFTTHLPMSSPSFPSTFSARGTSPFSKASALISTCGGSFDGGAAAAGGSGGGADADAEGTTKGGVPAVETEAGTVADPDPDPVTDAGAVTVPDAVTGADAVTVPDAGAVAATGAA
jgi:hypothetical protein